MNSRMLRAIGLLSLIILTSCSSTGPWYWKQSSLNSLSLGMSKESLLQTYPGAAQDGRQVTGMQIRAARKTDRGTLLEVGEVPLIQDVNQTITSYWFLFEDGRLVQWGRPEDWRAVSARYDIHFNPSPSVPR